MNGSSQPSEDPSPSLRPSNVLRDAEAKTVDSQQSSQSRPDPTANRGEETQALSLNESSLDTNAISGLDQPTLDHTPQDPDATQPAVAGASPSAQTGTRYRVPKSIGGYVIQSILGRGGMGIVYKAKHKKLDREVALKMVLAGSHASNEQQQRFIQEAKAVAHLQHPNIVQIFEVGEEEGLPFFSLEFVEGESLDKQVREKPLDPRRAAKLTATLARAMQYAHDHHIIHRDLKPANVLVSSNGVPKITDFGLAKRLEDADDSGSTRTGTIMGTPSYMSPEQASGENHTIGPATDQYSLGAMLYEFMTGRPPFMASKPVDTILQVRREEPIPPRQLQPKLPIDLETICLKALQKDVSKRYANCEELALDLDRYVRGEPISARPISQFERAWRWCRRNPILASLSALAIAALASVAIISSISAWLVSSTNQKLANANIQLKDLNQSLETAVEEVSSANASLEKKNVELAESITEQQRRTERLQNYVQGVFVELNKINLLDNPRMRDYKNETLKKTLPLFDEIVRELPEGGQAASTKMSAQYQLAMSYRDLGKGREAEQTILSLIELARSRVQLMGGSDASRNNLVLMLRELSNIRQELNRDIHACITALEEARGIAESIVQSSQAAPNGFGKFAEFERDLLLASVERDLGVALYRQGNSKGALPHLTRALELQDSWIDRIRERTAFENMPPTTRELTDNDKALIQSNLEAQIRTSKLALANAKHRTGGSSDTETVLREIVANEDQELAKDPSSPLQLRRIVGILGIWGEFLAQTDRIEDARGAFQRSADLVERMLNSNPESAEFQKAAGTSYYRFAQWFSKMDPERAKSLGDKSLAIRQKLSDAEPTDDRRKLDLLLPMGRFGDVMQTETIADSYMNGEAKDSEMMLQIAESLSQASLRAATTEDSTRLKSKALDAIDAMLALGHTDVVTLEKDIDLVPILLESRFQKVLDQLRAGH